MLRELREDDITADAGRRVADHGGGGFIAAGFYPEHEHDRSVAAVSQPSNGPSLAAPQIL
jgi:hypothetical protein